MEDYNGRMMGGLVDRLRDGWMGECVDRWINGCDG